MADTDESPNPTPKTEPSPPPPEPPPAPRRSWPRRLVPLAVLLLAGIIFLSIVLNWNVWTGGQSAQRTDDACLRADITPLSTRVSGTVTKVAVEDYQRVKAGDLLVQLRDDDLRAQVEQAEAAVEAVRAALENNAKQKLVQESRIEQARASVEASRAEIMQADANIEAARSDIAAVQAGIEGIEADLVRARAERQRQEALVAAASATRQRLEQVVAEEARLTASLTRIKADLERARAALWLRQGQARQVHAGLKGRLAEVDVQRKQRAALDTQENQLRAELRAREEAVKVARTNLEYTRILAPNDGMVGERKVRVGQLVSPGLQVISLVENDVWVQANYKETQLAGVRKGDPVEVTVDSFPGVTLKGTVREIAPASGSQFALLPPDNATGNFTKIVQRIPVKIVIEPDPRVADRLRPGMSAVVAIRTSGGGSRNER